MTPSQRPRLARRISRPQRSAALTSRNQNVFRQTRPKARTSPPAPSQNAPCACTNTAPPPCIGSHLPPSAAPHRSPTHLQPTARQRLWPPLSRATTALTITPRVRHPAPPCALPPPRHGFRPSPRISPPEPLTNSPAVAISPPHPAPTPALSDLYRGKTSTLSESSNLPDFQPQTTELLRDLISKVRMAPDWAASGFHHIELFGDLAGPLSPCAPDMTKPRRLVGAGVRVRLVILVAGAGFEPAAFRL